MIGKNKDGKSSYYIFGQFLNITSIRTLIRIFKISSNVFWFWWTKPGKYEFERMKKNIFHSMQKWTQYDLKPPCPTYVNIIHVSQYNIIICYL